MELGSPHLSSADNLEVLEADQRHTDLEQYLERRTPCLVDAEELHSGHLAKEATNCVCFQIGQACSCCSEENIAFGVSMD